MFEELGNKIVEVDFDVLITFISTLAIIFFGITTDVRDKQFRMKNILALYILLFICVVFTSNMWVLIVFLALGFIAGGIILLHDKDNDLEKELNIVYLIFYYSLSWLLYNKNYIWIISVFVVLISINMDLDEKYIVAIILMFLIYHYCTVSVNFFDFHNFEKAFSFLKISFLKLDSGEAVDENADYNQAVSNIHLVSFLLYMEDKNMFLRDTPHMKFKTDFINSKFKNKDRTEYFSGIEFNERKGIRRYIRGYSTIEQQYFRQRILKDNSYRYKIRRTLFIILYTKFFFRAACLKRSKSFSRKALLRRKYSKKLRWNLKYHVLMSYYIDIHKNPGDINALIESMAKQSRVSANLYRKIYDNFQGSDLETEYINLIKEAKTNECDNMKITFNFKKV